MRLFGIEIKKEPATKAMEHPVRVVDNIQLYSGDIAALLNGHSVTRRAINGDHNDLVSISTHCKFADLIQWGHVTGEIY